MTLFWIALFILLFTTLVLFIFPTFIYHPKIHDTNEVNQQRKKLNTLFYQQRMAEIAQDAEQGFVMDRQSLVNELQHTLLNDIPQNSSSTTQSIHRGWLIPGIIALFVIAGGCYILTGNFNKASELESVIEDYPTLTQRILNKTDHVISFGDLSRLKLGLITQVHNHPDSSQSWLILGRIYLSENQPNNAEQAFAHAWQLTPNDMDISLEYCALLIKSDAPDADEKANTILTNIIKKDHTNLQALNLLAFNALSHGRYQQAVITWQFMLKLIPKHNADYNVIYKSLQLAQKRLAESAK